MNRSLPAFYKTSLFNELYYVADGGSIWLNTSTEHVDETKSNDKKSDYGRFAYLEGHEYRMYNTYDVHFNASFALLMLWPELHVSLQYDYAATIDKRMDDKRRFLFTGETGCMKSERTMPHDLGDPEDAPWQRLNAYLIHDTKDWKDLNIKFILTCYRDYVHLGGDMGLLRHMWPKIKALMLTVQAHDSDGDGLIDSHGQPDQTYDAWSVTGASAYCGGLHVACLACVCEMARVLGDSEASEVYASGLERAKAAYDAKLWNGIYYKYDCGTSGHSDSIMTDMCCGRWYLRSAGFARHQVFDEARIRSCLETIYANNVLLYGGGGGRSIGSVNGMRPNNGGVDTSSMQSEEMWIGTTCALASLMIHEVR